jgi:hypothetical protein
MSKDMMGCGCAANAQRRMADGSYVDACVIHNTTEKREAPDLSNRQARCAHCRAVRPSSLDLPFFEYRGLGSREAAEKCKCGYLSTPHTEAHQAERKERGRPPFICKNGGFEAAGPNEFDLYYCGCRGWD